MESVPSSDASSLSDSLESTLPNAQPPAPIKSQPMARANALIGAALQAPLRGRFLLLVRIGWLGLVVVTIGLFILTIPSRYSQLVIAGAESSIALQELGLSPSAIPTVIGAFDAIIFISYTFVGALIFSRKSHEWIGLLASLALITAVFALVRSSDSLLFVDAPLRVPLLVVLAIAVISVTIFIYIFPDGHFVPRWMRWIVAGLCAFSVYGLIDRAWLTQPFRWPPAPLSPIIILGIFGGALVQIYRYRRVSDAAQREQMKWVVFGVAIGALGLVGFQIILPAAFPRVVYPGMTRVFYFLVAAPLFFTAMLLLPISLGISILRYHLWDIDLIISRTLLYVSLTAVLAGLFAALENIMQDVFVLLTGETSELATVIATLTVVATFTPLKDAIQKFVERRFKDATNPAEKLKTFSELVETRVTPLYTPQITRRLLLEALKAFDAKGGAAYLDDKDESRLLESVGDWDGEAAICFPIQSSTAAARFGWIALDDRKNGAPYSEQDRQILEATAQKVARALEEDLVEDRD